MIRSVSVAFLFATTVFQTCGDLNKAPPPPKNDPNIQPDPSALPRCLTDPPFGCVALCMNPAGSLPVFSDQCDPGGGVTDEFEQAVNAIVDQAVKSGVADQLCVTGAMLIDTTPCDVGITPVLLEEPPLCQLPKPGCKQ